MKVDKWSREQVWVEKHAIGKGAEAQVYRIILACFTYFTWQERNNMIFQNSKRSEDQLVKLVAKEIHGRGNCKVRVAGCTRRMNYYP